MNSKQPTLENTGKSALKFTELVAFLLPFLKDKVKALVICILALLFFVVLSRLKAYSIGWFVDDGVTKENLSALKKYMGLFVLFTLISMLFSFLKDYLFAKLGVGIIQSVRDQSFARTLDLPLDYFHKNAHGRIIHRLTADMEGLRVLVSESMVSFITHLFVFASIVISMLWISTKLTLALLALVPLFLWVARYFSRKLKLSMIENKKRHAQLNAFFSENLNGMKMIKVFSAEEKQLENFQFFSKRYRESQIEQAKNMGFLIPAMHFFSSLSIMISLYYGGFLSLGEDGLSIGALLTFFILVQEFINPLRMMVDTYQNYQNGLTSAERVMHLFSFPSEHSIPIKNQEPLASSWTDRSHKAYLTSTESSNRGGEIRARNLSFKYSPESKPALKGLDFTIKAGTKVALIGPTGSGKTTLVSLLERLYEPNKGELFIDQMDVSEMDKKLLRLKVGVVAQDPWIFPGTILENISLKDPRLNIETLQIAAALTGLKDILSASGRDLDFLIEGQGSNLSFGERQLISFARIIAFDPAILVLDEATSNMDIQSEEQIKSALNLISKKRTTLIIAHRLSTLQNVDQIMVLKQGELIEMGTPEELLQERGFFYSLLELSGASDTQT